MSNYVNNQGLSAGPIRITDITNRNHNGTWLLSHNSAIYSCNNWFLPYEQDGTVNVSNLSPIHARNSSILEDSELANVGTVKNMLANWDPNAGDVGFDSRYASAQDMELINKIVFGPTGTGSYDGKGLIVEMANTTSTLNTFVLKVEALEPQVNTLTINLTELTEKVNSHITNPFPEGVIFIGGGA